MVSFAVTGHLQSSEESGDFHQFEFIFTSMCFQAVSSVRLIIVNAVSEEHLDVSVQMSQRHSSGTECFLTPSFRFQLSFG